MAPIKKKSVHVCRECHMIAEGEYCTNCGSANLSEDWAGYLIIIDPENSDVAEKMNIEKKGRYALKVR
jgi:DNA-directed RNA polymerase subunit E"